MECVDCCFEFGKWLWNCGEFFFVIVESLWIFLEIALIFLEIALGNFRKSLWFWLYEGDIGELLEILGICLKNWETRVRNGWHASGCHPKKTHSARVLTRLSRTWSVYHLCMLPSFWAGHVGVMLIVCMFFSHPYLSLSDWLGYVPPLLWNLGPGVCAGPSFKKFFWDQVSF